MLGPAVLFLGALDAVALGVTKRKAGERESSWTTTGGPDEFGEWDCEKEDETDLDTILRSTCFWFRASIVYEFLVPRRARLRGFNVDYDGGGGAGCLVESMRMARVAPRRASVFFHHKGVGNYPWSCHIHSVGIRYIVPR